MTGAKQGAWRLFSLKAILEAREWQAAGGVAVHLSGNHTPPGCRKPTACAHVLAPDLVALKAVAAMLGMPERWIQYPKNDHKRHLDVWGSRLALAASFCENQEPITRNADHEKGTTP